MAASTSEPAAADGPPAPAGRGTRHPAMLAAALILAVTYAAFAAGATRYPQETRLQVLIALAGLGAVVSWATGGGIRWRASRPALVGLALLFAVAGWAALGLLWSTTPDRTWLEANRAIAYALVVALALALGASDPRAIERTAVGLLAGATLVALYALGTKTLPGLSVPGLLDLDQPGSVGRLRTPLGYWNALALVMALALPVAVRLAADPGRRGRARAGALAAGLLLVCTIGLTYSRGGVLAVGVASVVVLAFGAGKLRGVLVLALLGAAATPALAVAFALPGTSEAGTALAERESDGLVLLATLLACLAGLLAVGFALTRLEPRVRWSARRTRTLFRLLGILAAFGVLLGVTGLAVSERGLPGTVADRARAFTEPSRDDVSDPGRLATTTSGNRWAWWKEAVGAWSDAPVVGWGAGSFRALHLRYRVDELAVTQAHSVPLQFLAETGLVGFLLVVGAFGALGLAAVRRVRASPPGSARELGVAGLGAIAAWGVHGLFDWDWNIPGATLPALVLLGVLAGGGAGRAVRPVAPAAVVAVAALVFSLVAASSVLPSWAESKASDAQVALREGADEVALAEAAAQADLAARLDPLGLRPLLASATIARRRGRLLESRAFLLEAVERQPDSAEAWLALSGAAFLLADRIGFERAALRALALDPRSPRARDVALAAVANRTPPGSSATAVGTPLTPAPVAAPPVVVPPPIGPTGASGPTGPTAP